MSNRESQLFCKWSSSRYEMQFPSGVTKATSKIVEGRYEKILILYWVSITESSDRMGVLTVMKTSKNIYSIEVYYVQNILYNTYIDGRCWSCFEGWGSTFNALLKKQNNKYHNEMLETIGKKLTTWAKVSKR